MAYIDEIRKMNLETSKGERFNENDLIYINALYTAINNIEQRYLKRITPLSNGKEVEVIEREYSSELKTQTYTVFRDDDSNPLCLYCDHEGSKTFFCKPWDFLCSDDKYPDIIIHKGDLPESGIQEIVCEIKRLSQLGSEKMLVDLNKLTTISGREIWEGHGYRIPIFIVINGTRAQLEDRIKNYKNVKYTILDLLLGKRNRRMSFKEYVTDSKERLKNVICLCHSAEAIVETCTVYDVVRSKIGREKL